MGELLSQRDFLHHPEWRFPEFSVNDSVIYYRFLHDLKKSPEHRVSNIFVLISSWKYNIVHKYLFFCSYSLILSILNTMKLQEYSTWLSIQVSILLFSWFRHWENYLIKFINRKQHIAVSPWVWRSRKISFLRKIRRDKTHGEDCSTY